MMKFVQWLCRAEYSALHLAAIAFPCMVPTLYPVISFSLSILFFLIAEGISKSDFAQKTPDNKRDETNVGK